MDFHAFYPSGFGNKKDVKMTKPKELVIEKLKKNGRNGEG